jgi:hypothetical protein
LVIKFSSCGTAIAFNNSKHQLAGGNKMFNLKNIIYKFEKLMTAVTFAEAGQRDTAYKIMNEKPVNRSKRNTEKVRNRIDQRPVLRA